MEPLDVATADVIDVQALQHEVERLKALLHQERAKSITSSISSEHDREHSRTRAVPSSSISTTTSTQQQHVHTASSPRRDPSPRNVVEKVSSIQRAKNAPRSSNTSTGIINMDARVSASLDEQLMPVNTKRGKWWLKDRRVLSRSTPTAAATVIKVRESWSWSGRTVVVDKIVACPTTRVNKSSEHDEEDVGAADTECKATAPSTSSGRLVSTLTLPADAPVNIDTERAPSAVLDGATTSDRPLMEFARRSDDAMTPAIAASPRSESSRTAATHIEQQTAVDDAQAEANDAEELPPAYVHAKQQEAS